MKATLKDLELELWLRRRGMREIKWQMQNWREIPINDMDERQLVNAIERLQHIVQQENIEKQITNCENKEP